jgi:hypothetical protein
MKKLLLAPFLALACCTARDARPSMPVSYASPEATVRSYWHRMIERRHVDAVQCFLDAGPSDAAGMLSLPDLVELRCRDFRLTWQGGGVVDVLYNVEYRVAMGDSLQSFPTGDRLNLTSGGWKIALPLFAAARGG